MFFSYSPCKCNDLELHCPHMHKDHFSTTLLPPATLSFAESGVAPSPHCHIIHGQLIALCLCCSGCGAKTQVNNGSKPLPFEFVSLYLRGKSDGFTLKGGDATQGTLDVQYDGPRPDPKIAGTCGKTGTYQPMRKVLSLSLSLSPSLSL